MSKKNTKTDSKGEIKTRKVFENLFDKPFTKVSNLPWLYNSVTNRHLELDGYCKELNIAFERQGEQHYTNEYQIQIDTLKKLLCKKNKVILIAIPFWVADAHLKEFILIKLKKHEIIPIDKKKVLLGKLIESKQKENEMEEELNEDDFINLNPTNDQLKYANKLLKYCGWSNSNSAKGVHNILYNFRNNVKNVHKNIEKIKTVFNKKTIPNIFNSEKKLVTFVDDILYTTYGRRIVKEDVHYYINYSDKSRCIIM